MTFSKSRNGFSQIVENNEEEAVLVGGNTRTRVLKNDSGRQLPRLTLREGTRT
jgi:hypothetical protein